MKILIISLQTIIQLEIDFTMRLLITLSLFIFTLTTNAQATEQGTLSDQADRINYTIGHQIGSDFKRQKVTLDEQSFKLGIQDGHNNTTPVINKKEMAVALSELKKNITTKTKKEAQTRIEKRRKEEKQKRDEGISFMLQNQKKEGIKTMPSGLQYRVLTKGKGLKPKAEDYVTFNYRARTIHGKEFDSSYKKGNPATYKANGVLPGFTEAIQMMQPGAKWELYLPPELAYGRHGPYAHQTIIIETELLSVRK